MHTQLIFLFTSFLLIFAWGCGDDEDFGIPLDENGLTREITDLVPQEIIDEMLRLGMPIYGGATPPDLSGTYLGSPFILLRSNRPSDVVGQLFSDYRLSLYGQENDNLSIMTDYINGPERGDGIGSFIVGDGCKFSVFIEVNSVTAGTDAKLVHLISGELEPEGIRNMHFANFMIDNFDNPAGVWIENGEGRVIHDSDGYSERIGSTPGEWYDRLPDCPCELDVNIHETREGCGKWIVCEDASEVFHFGSSYEIRWSPDEEGQAGQQCTYDINKKLITAGIAAGSPDIVSPGFCGYGDLVNSFGAFYLCFSDHCNEDVEPWKKGTDVSIPCWQYLRDWPANKGANCENNNDNPVTDIQHMLVLVGRMTCEEVSDLMREVFASSYPDERLRSYLLGSGGGVAPTNTEIIDMLKDWKRQEEDATITDDDLVAIIDQAVRNLGG